MRSESFLMQLFLQTGGPATVLGLIYKAGLELILVRIMLLLLQIGGSFLCPYKKSPTILGFILRPQNSWKLPFRNLIRNPPVLNAQPRGNPC